GDVGDLRHGCLHCAECLENGRRWLSGHAHRDDAVDPKKFLEMQRRNPQLNREEFEFLKSHATLTPEIGVLASTGANVHSGKELSEGVQIMGASPNIGVILNFEAAEGRFISEIEDRRHMYVAFIGKDLKDKFFPGGAATGQNIMVNGIPFQVV